MAFSQALEKAGAPDDIRELFALWTSEIGPDFWTFCCSGMAQPGTLKEILALPSSHVFRVSWTDPHPPPYLRVLLSIESCRQVWGSGVWDSWEKDWRELYPLDLAPSEDEKLLTDAARYVPLIARTLLQTRFRVFGRKAIPDLFNLPFLAPSELQKAIKSAGSGSLPLRDLRPCAHLAVFRLMRAKLSEESLDDLMTKWLLKLGKKNGQY